MSSSNNTTCSRCRNIACVCSWPVAPSAEPPRIPEQPEGEIWYSFANSPSTAQYSSFNHVGTPEVVNHTQISMSNLGHQGLSPSVTPDLLPNSVYGQRQNSRASTSSSAPAASTQPLKLVRSPRLNITPPASIPDKKIILAVPDTQKRELEHEQVHASSHLPQRHSPLTPPQTEQTQRAQPSIPAYVQAAQAQRLLAAQRTATVHRHTLPRTTAVTTSSSSPRIATSLFSDIRTAACPSSNPRNAACSSANPPNTDNIAHPPTVSPQAILKVEEPTPLRMTASAALRARYPAFSQPLLGVIPPGRRRGRAHPTREHVIPPPDAHACVVPLPREREISRSLTFTVDDDSEDFRAFEELSRRIGEEMAAAGRSGGLGKRDRLGKW